MQKWNGGVGISISYSSPGDPDSDGLGQMLICKD